MRHQIDRPQLNAATIAGWGFYWRDHWEIYTTLRFHLRDSLCPPLDEVFDA